MGGPKGWLSIVGLACSFCRGNAFRWCTRHARQPLPFVEPAILASVVALGLLVALAVDIPIGTGAAVITVFALFHGYAHGSEVKETVGGVEYMAGFALATATLHLLGIGFAKLMTHFKLQHAIRVKRTSTYRSGSGLDALGSKMFPYGRYALAMRARTWRPLSRVQERGRFARG